MQINYPTLLDRIKAVFADYIILILCMFCISYTFEYINTNNDLIRIIAFLFVFCLYDPLFTSIFGGTIGHLMFGIRVKREQNEEKNIFFLLAILRFFFKFLLGWISLLTVTSNNKKKAIHDYIVKSVVIYKK